MPSITDQLEDIIRDVSGYEEPIEADWDLVGKRIIKSVMLLEIIAIIEEDFDIEVTAQHVYEGHFTSVKSMKKFLKQQQ